MKRRRFNAVWLVVGFVVPMCAGLYWLTSRETMKTLQQKYPNVKVYYEDDEPSQPENPHDAIADSTGEPTATPADRENIASATPSQSQSIAIGENERVFLCSIRDPLGEPVERGIVRLGDTAYPFQLGSVRIKLDSAVVDAAEIAAEADGYQSATQTVDLKESSQIDITLDYLCDFEIRVQHTTKTDFWNDPVWSSKPGAELVLYRAEPCSRPLQHAQRALIEYEIFHSEPLKYDFAYDDGTIRIERINALSSFYESIEIAETFQPDEIYFPKAGDLVNTIGWRDLAKERREKDPSRLHKAVNGPLYDYALPWNAPPSQNARLMDSLALALKQDTSTKSYTEIRLARDDGRVGGKLLFMPPFRGTEEIVARTVSGTDGTCRFNRLKPGLYFVQARDFNQQGKNQRSRICPLFPSIGGANLKLESKCNLTVYTLLDNPPADCFLQAKRVTNTQISLRPKDASASGMYSAETSDYALSKFKALPFGTYTLTARPPEKSKLAPVQEEIVLDVPLKIHTVSFKNWDRHDIEGTAVLHDTKAPIPDQTIELYESRFGSFYPSAVTKTDEDGAFAFRGLPQGNYQIRYVPDPQNDHKYHLFEPLRRAPEDHSPFYIRSLDDEIQSVFVRDDPVYTVEILLVVTVATRFSGKVIDSEKRPVPNSEITLFRHASNAITLEIYPPRDTFQSDEEGHFDITIWTRDLAEWRETVYSGMLTAKTFAEIPQQAITPSRLEKVRELAIDPSQRPVLKSGSLDISFQLGDYKKDLTVVVDSAHTIALEGRIRTEDGLIPEDAKVTISYYRGNDGIMGEYMPNGDFVVSGVENEGFLLYVRYAYCKDESNSTGMRELRDEMVDFQPSQINEMFRNAQRGEPMKLEIILKDSCYLNGVVLDANKNPLPNVVVRTDPVLGKAQCASTNREGKFHISQLEKEKIYSLYVSKDIEDVPDLVLSDLYSNTDDIILIWENAPKE